MKSAATLRIIILRFNVSTAWFGEAIKVLEQSGELDNTIVVMTGDHGMPFPRCKSNNYDRGARVPLAIRWPSKVKAGTVVKDFVSLVDVAPTVLSGCRFGCSK